MLLQEQILFFRSLISFWKGSITQVSQQKVTKVVPFCENGENILEVYPRHKTFVIYIRAVFRSVPLKSCFITRKFNIKQFMFFGMGQF